MKAAALFMLTMGIFLLLLPMLAINSNVAPSVAPPLEAQTSSALPPHMRQDQTSEPFDSYPPEDTPEPGAAPASEPAPPEATAVAADITVSGADSFTIFDEGTGRVFEVSARDYVRGAVAAEMPASFEPEALKAQAVAAYTYALHNKAVQQISHDPALMGADFLADPGNLKVFIPEETAMDFYGEMADHYWKKICEAADSVEGLALVFEGEPIVAAYHAISSGMTEDAANVWIGEAPYLQSVPSEGDPMAPGYETEVTFTPEEAEELITAAYPEADLSGDPAGWFGEPGRSEAGYVTDINVGGVELHGKEVRVLFDLRSHNFVVTYGEDGFVFTVTGYGHGVGLSQYGADFLAKQGMDYKEILNTYYTDVELAKIKSGSE